jgi:signal transduction histidine kinase
LNFKHHIIFINDSQYLFLRKVFNGKTKKSCCEVTLSSNNSNLPMYVYLNDIVTENGEQCLVTVINITERKQAEELIEQKSEQLEKANAEKDKFFSIIAHDLRSPFQTLLGFARMMVEELPTLTLDEMQKIAVSMRNSASNLYHLLENLLHWSRIQQGLIHFNPEVVQLLTIVDESMEMALEPAKNKGIEIAYNIPDDIKVFADSNMLQTVIRNLVSNAVKFTPKGGKIRLSAKASGNKSVVISIKDSGIGMSSAMVENLFRLNVQTNGIGTEGEPSTSLVLIICKEFIEKHGGKLWVESEEGKGGTFYFTLKH